MEELILQFLDFLSIPFTVFLISMLPVIELRGAIPIGISLGLTPWEATTISFIGSMLPVPFILYMIISIFNYLQKTRLFKKLVNSLTDRSIKNREKIQKYGFWGLILVVAIPLPGTGVWSGSLAAALLGIRFKIAFPAILIGNLIAAIAVLSLSQGFFRIFS